MYCYAVFVTFELLLKIEVYLPFQIDGVYSYSAFRFSWLALNRSHDRIESVGLKYIQYSRFIQAEQFCSVIWTVIFRVYHCYKT